MREDVTDQIVDVLKTHGYTEMEIEARDHGQGRDYRIFANKPHDPRKVRSRIIVDEGSIVLMQSSYGAWIQSSIGWWQWPMLLQLHAVLSETDSFPKRRKDPSNA